jgi:hypothetical protein
MEEDAAEQMAVTHALKSVIPLLAKSSSAPPVRKNRSCKADPRRRERAADGD